MDQTTDINKFFAKHKIKEVPAKEVILSPEEKIEFIYLLESGVVRSYAISIEGHELTLNIYKEGSIFPITTLLAERVNSFYFETMTPSKLMLAPALDVCNYLENDKEALFDMTKRISRGLEGFVTRSMFFSKASACQKVASSMVMLAKRFGEKTTSGNIKINLPLTHQDLANLAGISRETASIEIKKLERMNIIKRLGKITDVLDMEKLVNESELYYEDVPLPYSF